MTVVHNVCRGWTCDLASKCDLYHDKEARLTGWVKHFQPPHTGAFCPHFEPKKMRAWGEGKETND